MLLNSKEGMYGGAAGGGKSSWMLMSALQYVDVPDYAALIIRQTFAQLAAEGGLMDKAEQWLGGTDAIWNGQLKRWTFPSGASLNFGFLQYDNDRYNYQSTEYQFVAFDELTHWRTDKGYRYLFSRLRQPDLSMRSQLRAAPDGLTVADVPLRMRSGTNPGGAGHGWVFTRFIEPWRKYRAGLGPKPERFFLPARLADNPYINQETYLAALSELDPIELARLLEGDWDAKVSGNFFNRDYFGKRLYRSDIPAEATWCRFWDLASGEATAEHPDPDWTAGALCAMHEGRLYVVEIDRFRLHPGDVEDQIRECAARDGVDVPIRMETEPGSGGNNTISHYSRNVLNGYDFDGNRPTGDKETQARPWAAKHRRGEVKVCHGEWVEPFLSEAEEFPDGAHDDQVDAVSGAFHHLAGLTGRKRVKVSIIV